MDDVMLPSSNKECSQAVALEQKLCALLGTERFLRGTEGMRSEDNTVTGGRRDSKGGKKRSHQTRENCTMLQQTTIGGRSRAILSLLRLSHSPPASKQTCAAFSPPPHPLTTVCYCLAELHQDPILRKEEDRRKKWLYFLLHSYVRVQRTLLQKTEHDSNQQSWVLFGAN